MMEIICLKDSDIYLDEVSFCIIVLYFMLQGPGRWPPYLDGPLTCEPRHLLHKLLAINTAARACPFLFL